MVIFFMGKCAHIYSKCLMICNISKGRDHVELTSVPPLPRISEILNKYLLNKSIKKIYIYIFNNRIYSLLFYVNIYITNAMLYLGKR